MSGEPGEWDESDESDSASPPTRRRTRSTTLLVCAAALVAALAVALILSLLALSNQDAQASSRTSALVAAKTYAVQLASYDYRDLQRASPRWPPTRRPPSVAASPSRATP